MAAKSVSANRPNAGVRGERESLLNTPALLIMSAIVAIAFYVLFPRQPAFRDPQNLRANDALSIAYLRVLVRSDPENAPLRLSFVQLLTEAGEHEEAITALAPLLVQPVPQYAFEIGLATLRLKLQRLFLDPNAEDASALRHDIGRGFDQTLALARKESEQDLLLAQARLFGDPRVLAALYESVLARPESNGLRRGRLLADTASLHLSANQPAEAATRWQQAFPLLTSIVEKRMVALSSLRAFLAANDPAGALLASKVFLHALDPASGAKPKTQKAIAIDLAGNSEATSSHALLALAADIAQQNGDDAQARSWLYTLRTMPDQTVSAKEELTERLLSLELALGDLPAALTLSRELATSVIPGSERQRLLARSFDWNDLPQESLPHWFALAMTTPDEESETRAFDLAVALADDDKVVALVESAAARRSLRGAEANAYVSAGLRVLDPNRIVTNLQAYLKGEGKDRAAWQAMARLREALGEPQQALVAWQTAEQLLALRPSERLAIAQAYWRSGQAEPALNSLLRLSSSPPAGQEARYWRTLAEIAWSLERDNVARTAYQQLLARYQPDDKLAIDRLLVLANRSGDKAAYERLSLYGWSRLHERDYFVRLMTLAHDGADFARLDQLLQQADQQASRFANEPTYWQYRAEREMTRGEDERGLDDLKKLATLRANDPEIIEALLWSLLAKHTALKASAQANTNDEAMAKALTDVNAAIFLFVERYAVLASADPLLAEAMAAAELTLGRPADAARWYLQTLAARKRDLLWLLTTADNLEWLGCTVTANQFRLRSLQQLQGQVPPMAAVPHPRRLADYFYGRRYFDRGLENIWPDDESLRDRVAQWQLSDRLDNARLFALAWQRKRLSSSRWEDLASAWREQHQAELAAMLQGVTSELAVAPEGPLSSAVLPLSLNDVAARGRRILGGKSAVASVPDMSKELPICRQTLEQFSALALPPLASALPVDLSRKVKP